MTTEGYYFQITQDGEDILDEPFEFNYGTQTFPDADEIEYDPEVFPDLGPLHSEEPMLPLPASNAVRRASSALRCAVGGHADLVLRFENLIQIPDTEEARIAWDLNPYRSASVLKLFVHCLRCGRETEREYVRATSIGAQEIRQED